MTTAYKPVAGTNAIEMCTVIVRFAAPAPSDVFERIRAAGAQVAADNNLPAIQQITIPPQLLNVIGMQLPPFPQNVVYQRFAPNGQPEIELRCEQSALTLQVRKYEGWTKLAQLLENTVIKLVPEYLSGLPAIASVGIQYDDKFLGGSAADAPPAAELIREGCPWITVYDRASRLQWHSTFGMFLREEAEGRELINVNYTVSEQADPAGVMERDVLLTVLVSENYDIPHESPLIVTRETGGGVVRDLLVKARAKQRRILEEVLSDPYLAAINLTKDQV